MHLLELKDVPETNGSDGRHRRMSLRRKAETDGPFVFMSFHLGDIRLRHSSGPSQSPRRTSPRQMSPKRMPLRRMSPRRMDLRRMSPRRMAPRRRPLRRISPRRWKAETEAPETEAPETDVPETEEGRNGGRPRRMSPRQKVCVFKHDGRLECMLLSDYL